MTQQGLAGFIRCERGLYRFRPLDPIQISSSAYRKTLPWT